MVAYVAREHWLGSLTCSLVRCWYLVRHHHPREWSRYQRSSRRSDHHLHSPLSPQSRFLLVLAYDWSEVIDERSLQEVHLRLLTSSSSLRMDSYVAWNLWLILQHLMPQVSWIQGLRCWPLLMLSPRSFLCFPQSLNVQCFQAGFDDLLVSQQHVGWLRCFHQSIPLY